MEAEKPQEQTEAKTTVVAQNPSELPLEEFGEIKVGVPVGVPLKPQVLPEHLRCVPVRETNAYDLTLAISRELLDGVPIQLACMLAGADFEEMSTLASDHPAVERALNFSYASGIKNQYLEKIKKGDPKTAMEILGRMVPSLFGEGRSLGNKVGNMSITGSCTSRRHNKKVDYKNMSDEELAQLAGEFDGN